MKKSLLLSLPLLFLATSVLAAPQTIAFPVRELGGCKNEAACKAFCDQSQNRIGVCFDFAKKHNLLTQAEIANAEKFTKASQKGGPDFCQTSSGCNLDSYCEERAHLSQCLDFAENNNFISQQDLAEARRVEKAFKSNAPTPGGCEGKNDCLNYCADLSHTSECLRFAQAAGIVTAKEAEETQNFVSLMQSGQVPGGAQSKEQCLAYCREPGHLNECVDFGLKAGFLTSADAQLIQKTGGVGPGGCRSKGGCETYCNDSQNQTECSQFAQNHGLEVKFAGPGGCSDVDSCRNYCQNHQEDATCKQYAGQSGGSFKGPGGCSDEATCSTYCQKHYEESDCQKMMGQYGGFKGPGGCSDLNSCLSYCQAHPADSECQKYAAPSGQQGQFGGAYKGPGGCLDVDTCTAYCQSNSQDAECQKYASQYGGSGNQQNNQPQNQEPPPPQTPQPSQ